MTDEQYREQVKRHKRVLANPVLMSDLGLIKDQVKRSLELMHQKFFGSPPGYEHPIVHTSEM